MIIDASVAAKWFMQEPGSEQARMLIAREDLKAPDIIVAELLNALRKGVRDARLAMIDAKSAIAVIDVAIPTLAPCMLFAERAFDLSLELQHHINDCLYLALAIETDSVFVTADDAFVAKLAASPWRERCVALTELSPSA